MSLRTLAVTAALAALLPAALQAAEVRFEDITAASGVNFRHDHGGSGEKYMQETMGSGLALLDADGDGDLDLYLVNSGDPTGPGPRGANKLYLNDGKARFTEAPAASGGQDTGYGMGVAVGDYDGDGDFDIYVLNHGANVLFRNQGDGSFVDVTAAAGVGDTAWSSSAVFLDADADGDLDLFVVNYCDASVANHLWCGQKEQKWRAYCTPQVYQAQADTFYRNLGDGTFKEDSAAAGLVDRGGKGLGVVPLDADGDGDVDLHVANDSTPNQLWRNDGHGRFREVGLLVGIAYSEDGRSEAGMGTDAGDMDGDGRQDLVVTNLDYETNALLKSVRGTFVHAGYPAGLAAPSLGRVGFGTNWLDADNDGDLDLLVANGHIIDNIRLYNDTLDYAQPNQLFLNQGAGSFLEAGPEAGLGTPNVARGSAVGDLNGDGLLDMVISRNGGPPAILLNRTAAAGGWLTVQLRGKGANTAGLGARVSLVMAGGPAQMREIRSACSYQSASAPYAHFGLGTRAKVESLQIDWPSGLRETFPVPEVNRMITLRQGEGRVVTGEKGHAS